MSSYIPEWIKRHPIVAFYILAFMISWFGYFPQVAYTYGLFPFQSILFFVIGGLGPTIAAIIMASVLYGKNGSKELFKPFTYWRVSIRWYLVAFFANAVIWFLIISLPSGISLDIGKIGAWSILPPIFLANIFMNMWEEVGWRGFALPRLQFKYSAVTSSIIVGTMWGLWHLPLLLMKDYPMADYPIIPFFIGIIASSVLYTLIFNNTRGSLLLVTLFHAAGNTTGSFLEKGISSVPDFIVYEAVIMSIVAIVIVIIFGHIHLSRSAKRVTNPF